MFGHGFYHGTIRRYVVLFGTLFNDIYLNRPDSVHNETKSVKVPIAYGPKEKVLARLTADRQLYFHVLHLRLQTFNMMVAVS